MQPAALHRGFSDPVTGYGRLKIHKTKAMIKPKTKHTKAGGGNAEGGGGRGGGGAGDGGDEGDAAAASTSGARDVLASLEEQFPELVRPSG
jgi:hypothetical protein